jgi:hypothetical protein
MHDVISFVQETLGDESVYELIKLYKKPPIDRVNAYINDNICVIASFIQKTNSQRKTFFKKICTKEPTLDMHSKLVLFLCILVSMNRAKQLIDIRENYIRAFIPGESYRKSAEEAILAAHAINQEFCKIELPYEVFNNLGIDTYDDE